MEGCHTETFKIRQLKCSPKGVLIVFNKSRSNKSRSAVNMTGESDTAGLLHSCFLDSRGHHRPVQRLK